MFTDLAGLTKVLTEHSEYRDILSSNGTTGRRLVTVDVCEQYDLPVTWI